MKLTGEQYTGFGLGAVVGLYGMHINNGIVGMIGLAIFVAAGLNTYREDATVAKGMVQHEGTFVQPQLNGSGSINAIHVEGPQCAPLQSHFPAHLTARKMQPQRGSRYKTAPANVPPHEVFSHDETVLINALDGIMDDANIEMPTADQVYFDNIGKKLRHVSSAQADAFKKQGVPVVSRETFLKDYVAL